MRHYLGNSPQHSPAECVSTVGDAAAVPYAERFSRARKLLDYGYHNHYVAERQGWQDSVVAKVCVRTAEQARLLFPLYCHCRGGQECRGAGGAGGAGESPLPCASSLEHVWCPMSPPPLQALVADVAGDTLLQPAGEQEPRHYWAQAADGTVTLGRRATLTSLRTTAQGRTIPYHLLQNK